MSGQVVTLLVTTLSPSSESSWHLQILVTSWALKENITFFPVSIQTTRGPDGYYTEGYAKNAFAMDRVFAQPGAPHEVVAWILRH